MNRNDVIHYLTFVYTRIKIDITVIKLDCIIIKRFKIFFAFIEIIQIYPGYETNRILKSADIIPNIFLFGQFYINSFQDCVFRFLQRSIIF